MTEAELDDLAFTMALAEVGTPAPPSPPSELDHALKLSQDSFNEEEAERELQAAISESERDAAQRRAKLEEKAKQELQAAIAESERDAAISESERDAAQRRAKLAEDEELQLAVALSASVDEEAKRSKAQAERDAAQRRAKLAEDEELQLAIAISSADDAASSEEDALAEALALSKRDCYPAVNFEEQVRREKAQAAEAEATEEAIELARRYDAQEIERNSRLNGAAGSGLGHDQRPMSTLQWLSQR